MLPFFQKAYKSVKSKYEKYNDIHNGGEATEREENLLMKYSEQLERLESVLSSIDEIKAFLSFILEQSKETGLHVSCTIMSEEDTGEGYEIFAGHVSSCKGARLHRLLYGAIAVNENFRKAVTSALLEYERTKTVNRDKMSMN